LPLAVEVHTGWGCGFDFVGEQASACLFVGVSVHLLKADVTAGAVVSFWLSTVALVASGAFVATATFSMCFSASINFYLSCLVQKHNTTHNTLCYVRLSFSTSILGADPDVCVRLCLPFTTVSNCHLRHFCLQ
jgi:hypothetical protein